VGKRNTRISFLKNLHGGGDYLKRGKFTLFVWRKKRGHGEKIFGKKGEGGLVKQDKVALRSIKPGGGNLKALEYQGEREDGGNRVGEEVKGNEGMGCHGKTVGGVGGGDEFRT